MDIGILRERAGETRVALVPTDAARLVEAGHRVFLAKGAGSAAGFDDASYVAAGAKPIPTEAELVRRSGIVLLVAPPDRELCAALRPDHLVGAFLNLGSDLTRIDRLRRSGALALAYECVGTDDDYPIARATDVVIGEAALDLGLELARTLGHTQPRTLVLGSGDAARAAAERAAHAKLDTLWLVSPGECDVASDQAGLVIARSTPQDLEGALADRPLVIAAERAPGGRRAPTALRRDDVARMAKDSVLVDAAADQGCCAETSRPTTRHHPTTSRSGVLHCAWPGLASRDPARASTALSNALLPYVLELARHGFARAAQGNPAIASGLAIAKGALTHAHIARGFGLPCQPTTTLLA